MSHFYTPGKAPKFLTDIKTPPQAVKHGKAWPSVTTVLSITKDEFIDNRWFPQKLVDLARQHDLPWQVLKDMTYGFREHPFTGDMIPSSEFGTAVHKRIEEWLEDGYITASPFDDYAKPFVDWVEENEIEVIACEHLVSDARFKTAGSIDFIGRDQEGVVFMADYKCRSCSGKGKFYGKDCKQLAIESVMLAKQMKLDYNPYIISVCICANTANHFHKRWTNEEFNYYFEGAKLASKMYWHERMLKPKKLKKG